jgi:hypothetical protein
MHTQFVEQVPIPSLSDSTKKALAGVNERANKAARERLSIQTDLIRRIPDLCPPEREPKLTTRLREWWTLKDFAAFRAEVKKAFRNDIPLAERSSWEDWIKRDKVKIAHLTSEIAQAEAKIDAIVYDLFDLTSEEIELLESNI